jgi:hypothetical protein
MLFTPVSTEAMRAFSVLSALTMAALVGGRFLGRYARSVLIGATVVYIAAIVGFFLYHASGG